MPEETLFSSERMQTRGEIAGYLRTVADSLESGESITLSAGDQSITIDPPGSLEFEVEVEREGPTDRPGELSLELELEWDEDAADDGTLRIE
jgi:amphi-Trp domain-containing protein